VDEVHHVDEIWSFDKLDYMDEVGEWWVRLNPTLLMKLNHILSTELKTRMEFVSHALTKLDIWMKMTNGIKLTWMKLST